MRPSQKSAVKQGVVVVGMISLSTVTLVCGDEGLCGQVMHGLRLSLTSCSCIRTLLKARNQLDLALDMASCPSWPSSSSRDLKLSQGRQTEAQNGPKKP